jgi:CBS-domain-containing membrane protein
MSAAVIDIATAETVEVEAPQATTAKRRDLKKIGRNLARQITKGSFADLTVDAVMERKAVDRVQAKAVIAHAVKTLEGRGIEAPTFA